MSHYAGTALWLLVTITTAIASYTVNLKVAGARAEVTALRGRLVADTRAIRTLQAELRTRARLPEMQRWNDSVLKMSAPAAGQYLASPVALASFVPDPAASETASAPVPTSAPAPRFAITGDAPMPVPVAGGVVTVAYAPVPTPASARAPVSASASKTVATPARSERRAPAPAPLASSAVTQIAFRAERERRQPGAGAGAGAAAATRRAAAPRLADDASLTAGADRWTSQRPLAIEIAAPIDLLPPGAR